MLQLANLCADNIFCVLRLQTPRLQPSGFSLYSFLPCGPLSSGGKLPGGYHYLHVTKPAATNPTAPAANHVGFILTGCINNILSNQLWLTRPFCLIDVDVVDPG